MVMNSSRMSQKKPAPTIIFVNFVLYLTCMKKRITSEALKKAMARATKIFQLPRSTVEIQAVTHVRQISAANTAR
jgi:hypothetical protein